jgi:CubicO group peptidase (beta-lactamase class C family)
MLNNTILFIFIILSMKHFFLCRAIYIVLINYFFISCSENPIATNVDVSSKESVLKIIQAEQALQGLNSVAFCVVKNDSVLWMDALGYADKERKIIATPETRYLVASITKTITAVAALQLYERGLLNLDADVNQYLPFRVTNPAFPTEKITARMLLNHSSSIDNTNYFSSFDNTCFGFDSPLSLEKLLQDFFTSGGQFYSPQNYYQYKPGSQANYSNIGYALLGFLVERLSGQTYEQYCKVNIFIPLGMTKSELNLRNSPINELAIPYSLLVTGIFHSPHYTFPDIPAGGLRTTVSDLSKWLRALILNGKFNNVQLLMPRTMDLLKKPTIELQPGADIQMGLGVYIRSFGTLKLIGHGGGDQGFTGEMVYDSSTNVGCIVFTNTTIVNIDLLVNALIQYGAKQ